MAKRKKKYDFQSHKVVEYAGQTIYVPSIYDYLATDIDGDVYAYLGKPRDLGDGYFSGRGITPRLARVEAPEDYSKTVRAVIALPKVKVGDSLV